MADPEAGERTAKAISEEVVATLPPALVTGETPLGLSAGVARSTGDVDVMELMERADRALYAVKPGGRRAR